MDYILLVSHTLVLFPIGVCFWQYKKETDYKALYTASGLLYTAFFSICMHTYDYPDLIQKWDEKSVKFSMWFLLDHWASDSIIITTVLYATRYHSDWFYILSHLSSVLFLLCEFTVPRELIIFIVIAVGVLSALVKIKTLYLAVKHFYFSTILMFVFLGTAVYCLLNADGSDYKIIHSMWHILILSSAGLACLTKSRLDTVCPIDVIYTRPTSRSM